MTPKEFQKEITAVAREMGPRADIFASISNSRYDKSVVAMHVYTDGAGHGMTFSLSAASFEEIVPELRAKWDAHRTEHERQFVRKIAIKIIEITALVGECTDAALRGANFTDEEIARFGERACADANDIAGRGPFTVRKLEAKSNGAPVSAATEPVRTLQ